MNVTLDPDAAAIVDALLERGYRSAEEAIHSALVYFEMRPEDWERINEQARVGLESLEGGRVIEFADKEALLDYLERRRDDRLEHHHRDAS